jgi:two-component system response regulator YesN
MILMKRITSLRPFSTKSKKSVRPEGENMYKVLLVDDDKTARYILKRFDKWKTYGFAIAGEASDGKEALKMLTNESFDLVITDIKMPGMDGIEFLNELKCVHIDICMIFLSTHSDFKYAKQAIRLGVFDYVTKPVDDAALCEVLERVKHCLQEKESNRRKIQEEQRLIEESLAIHYPVNKEKEIITYILTGNAAVLVSAEDTFNDLAEMLGRDSLKLGQLMEIILANVNAELVKQFPWLPNFERTLYQDQIVRNDSLESIKDSFLTCISLKIKVIRKYELHHTDSVIRRTCQYVMEHIEENNTLEVVAQEVQLHKDYLSKMFKQKTGFHFIDYVTKAKMEHAKQLLGTGKYKNYEISEKLGYSSPDYFCRLFKNYTGHTPLEYKKVFFSVF